MDTARALIFDIKRFAVHDGPGIRTTVFLKGCPLSCPWCHNPEGLCSDIRLTFDGSRCVGKTACGVTDCPGPDALPDLRGCPKAKLENSNFVAACPTDAASWDGRHATVAEILEEIHKDDLYYDTSDGGVTISGGEPLAQPEALRELLAACYASGYGTTLDTTFFADWNIIEPLLHHIEHLHIDLKLMDPDKHKEVCGVDNSMILDNIRRLHQIKYRPDVLFRFPLIPGITDFTANLDAIASFLEGLAQPTQIEILPHHNLASAKYTRLGMACELAATQPPDEEQIRAVEARLTRPNIAVSTRQYRFPGHGHRLGPRNAELRRRALAFEDNRDPLARPLWFVRGFRSAPDDAPLIIKRAHAIKAILENLPLRVYPDQKILGESLRTIAGTKGVGEEFRWICRARMPEQGGRADPDHAPAEVVEELASWQGGSTFARVRERFSSEATRARQHGVFENMKAYFGHIIPNFKEALDRGYLAIQKEAQERLDGLIACSPPLPKAGPAASGRSGLHTQSTSADWYRAVTIVCDGALALGRRYAALAREQAEAAADESDRAHFLELAEMMDHVPANPPRTFREALQMVFLVHLFNEEESCSVYTHSFGRFDQYLYPFFQRDREQGILGDAEALALLEELWIKCYRLFDEQHTMLGGYRPDGTDGITDLSLLRIRALRNVALPHAMGARVHCAVRDDYLDEIISVLELGMGVPTFFNDDTIVHAFESAGMRLEHAREYGAVGCVETFIPEHAEIVTPAFFINVPKILELALNQGRSLIENEQIGPQTPAADTWASFDDVLQALDTQMGHALTLSCADEVIAEQILAADQPVPLYSCLIPACMEQGRDALSRQDAHHLTGVCMSQIATTVNSLAVIRKAVFEDGDLTMAGLVDMLRSNYAGSEAWRLRFAHAYPKFGNDDAGTDKLGSRVIAMFCRHLEGQPHAKGGRYIPLIFSRPHRQSEIFGVRTAATADGRHAGELLGVSLNPVNGTIKRGITAVVNSQNRLPLNRIAGGVSNNLDLDTTVLMGDGRNKVRDLIHRWCESGGMQLALQIASKDTLVAAQKSPEDFPDLCVRVYGFSERFVNLDKTTQNYLIERAG